MDCYRRGRNLARYTAVVVAFVLVALTGACERPSLDVFRDEPATAYDRYVRQLTDAGLDSTALGREWLAASDSALRAPLEASLPALEVGAYSRTEARAVAYRFSLKDGQRVIVTTRADGLPLRLYVDLFEVVEDTARPFVHRATADTLTAADSAAIMLQLNYEAHDDAQFVLRLQPELLRSGRYTVSIDVAPVLAFPVEGRGNGAIQSLFGVDRDAGRRVHHGIDIFAPRGTPVLAATDGVIRSTSPNNLGGIVVWLSDEVRRQSLYYAHLDTQIVQPGQRVRTGDTLGFVGNTGNARTTPPHLHFGIYRRGRGPIDPLPHVRLITRSAPSVAADTSRLGQLAQTIIAEATLRAAPTTSSDALRLVPRNESLHIMGANANWYRVQFADGETGYLTAAAVRLIE